MKKRNNKKGFTLAELLIVVAIIGVLVAISFPIFAGKMEKARIATDEANMRAAKAAATATYLLNEIDKDSGELPVWFDAKKGIMVESWPNAYGQTKEHKKCAIKVTKYPDDSTDENAEIQLEWKDNH